MEETKDEQKKHEVVSVSVRCIRHKGDAALVEWIDRGQYRRGFIPLSSIKDGTVKETTLKRAVPYGIPWEKCIKITATPEEIANELRRAGMWTLEDIDAGRLRKINRAFDYGEFINLAKGG